MSKACEDSFKSGYLKCSDCLTKYHDELKTCLSRETADPKKYNIKYNTPNWKYLNETGMKELFCQRVVTRSDVGEAIYTHKITDHNW